MQCQELQVLRCLRLLGVTWKNEDGWNKRDVAVLDTPVCTVLSRAPFVGQVTVQNTTCYAYVAETLVAMSLILRRFPDT